MDKSSEEKLKPQELDVHQNAAIKNRSLKRRRATISRLKRRALKHVWLVRITLILGFFAALLLVFFIIGLFAKNSSIGRNTSLISNFLLTPVDAVNSIDGRTNILILGKSGDGHDSPDLTDTIIFASVQHPSTSVDNTSISLVSLPRDIWIPELRAKLNSAYYWGNQKKENGGLVLVKSEVEKIVGKPISYGVVINFDGFEELIDVLGGIEVGVENSFTDEKYPIPGREDDECGGDPEFTCRYEMILFEEGVQTMNGETSLVFVRSRNAKGDEGTDLARSARQQKVLSAIKDKAISFGVLTNPKKMSQVVDVLRKSVETDIDPKAGAILARRLIQVRGNFYSDVLPEELLNNPPPSSFYDNLFIYLPNGDDWSGVHDWVECVLENGDCN